MDESVLEEILRRLNRLEDRLTDHDERLRVLEGQRALEKMHAPRPATAPAVKPTVTPPPVYRIPKKIAVFESKPVRESVDAEYQIGAKVLPYTGGAVVIIGLAYLVSLVVGRGLITPAMLWWGVNLLSLIFIGVGQWKRDEKEQFGQIITAIGSCGLYLNFAAGHVFQKLYEGETLVVLFVALSFINLAYAFWRSSRAFLGLGLMGGMIAALMPLKEDNFTVHVILHFLILAPSVLIAARNKWLESAAAITVVGGLATLPAAGENNALSAFTVLATALLTVSGYAWSFRKTELDPQGAYVPVVLFASALLGFGTLGGSDGAWAILLFGAAIAGCSLLPRESQVRQIMTASAIAIPAIIAPFGWFFPQVRGELGATIWILFGLTAVFAVGSRFRASKFLSVLAAIEFSLGLLIYLLHLSEHGMSWQLESLILALSGGLLALLCWALVKAHKNTESLVLGASVLAVPLATRLVQLLLGTPDIGASDMVGVTYGLMFAAAGAFVLAILSRWESSLLLLWSVMLLGLASLSSLLFGAVPAVLVELPLLFGFAALVAAAGLITTKIEPGKNVIWTVVGALGGLLFVRLGDLLLTRLGLTHEASVILGCVIVALVTSRVAVRTSLKEVAILPALFTLGAGLFYAPACDRGALPFGQDVLSVIALLIAAVVTTFTLIRSKTDNDAIYYAASIFGWIFATRLGYLVLTDANIGVKANASVSFAWTVFALSLITCGFWLRIRQLRYMSFAVLGSTVIKVLMVDLAQLDPILRVLILLLLGMVMLGGGYWYIRSRTGAPPSGGAKVPTPSTSPSE